MADDRPQYQHGTGTIGGRQFHWGSGTPGKYWSVPYGDYPVTPDAPTGEWAHRVGAIPIANNVIPDQKLGRDRIGIMIHSGSASSLDALYTQGCFKVAPEEWPDVRKEILAEAQKGPLYLHVQPGGVASFTNTKTMEQASIPTAGSPAPPAGTTTLNSNEGVIDALSRNIAGIESGGFKNPYEAVNPKSGALGKYQVMPNNVPGWTLAALGKEMTPAEFAASPEAQEKVFRDQMGRSLQLYGPKDAASIWFTGKPYAVAGGNVDDGITKNSDYVARATAGIDDKGMTLTSTPGHPHTLTPPTAGAPYTPEAVAAANPPPTFGESIAKGDVGGALRAALTKPPPTKDAQGNPVEQKSPLEKVGDAISSQGQKQAPAIPEQQQAMAVQDPDPGLAPAAQQLFSTVQAAAAKPLTWTSTPYGSTAGLQRPLGPIGTTLNATGYGYG